MRVQQPLLLLLLVLALGWQVRHRMCWAAGCQRPSAGQQQKHSMQSTQSARAGNAS
jgi:hypothetical protein